MTTPIPEPPSKARRGRRRRPWGAVFRRPGGPGWLCRFPNPNGRRTPNGRTAYVTRSVESRTDGEELLKAMREAILKGQYAPAAPEPKTCESALIECIDEYLEAKKAEGKAPSGIRRYEVSRSAIAKWPDAKKRVVDLQPRDLESFLGWRRTRRWNALNPRGKPGTVIERTDAAVSNSTVGRDLSLIAAALNRLVRLGLLEKSPLARVRRPKEVQRKRPVLTREEIGNLLGACSEPLRILVLAAWLTGQRPSEIKAIRWGDLNFEDKTISIFRKKVGNADTIPMHPRLAEEFLALKVRRAQDGKRIVADDEYVFLSARGRPFWDYRTPWFRALRDAGLDRRPGLTFYSLRHSFATAFLSHGAPSDLQALLGHASYLTTERYVRAVSGRARAGVEAL